VSTTDIRPATEIVSATAATAVQCEMCSSEMKPMVAYYRVSTQKQARSGKKGLGLGLEAQREALERIRVGRETRGRSRFDHEVAGGALDLRQIRERTVPADATERVSRSTFGCLLRSWWERHEEEYFPRDCAPTHQRLS
jgi:hypothetical protein